MGTERKTKSSSLVTLGEPIRLTNGRLTFEVGKSMRRTLERLVKPPIAYPGPGWQTWAVAGTRTETWILSAFYRNDVLVALEHYLPKTDRLPAYAPRIAGGFRFVPGEISLGGTLRALPAFFVSDTPAAGTVGSLVFAQLYSARWTAGVALVSGNDARIERLALYAAT